MLKIQQALELRASGCKLAEIANLLEFDRTTVRKWFQKFDATGELPETRERPTEVSEILATAKLRELYSRLFGIYLGDGCISKTGRPEGRTYQLCITSHAKQDRVVSQTEEALAAIFPYSKIRRELREPNTLKIAIESTQVPCLFPQRGPGLKWQRRLAMAAWQEAIVREYPEEFVKGLYLTDGCRRLTAKKAMFDGTTTLKYPIWLFKQRSPEITNWLRWALNLCGVEYGDVKADKAAFTFSIKTISLGKMDSIVGSKYSETNPHRPEAYNLALAYEAFAKRVEWPADETLYELLWRKPGSEIARELGCTATALHQHKRKRGIQGPPQNYWQKRQAA